MIQPEGILLVAFKTTSACAEQWLAVLEQNLIDFKYAVLSADDKIPDDDIKFTVMSKGISGYLSYIPCRF